MSAPTTTTLVTETHQLTNADLVEAVRRFVLSRSQFGGSALLDQITVDIRPCTSWEAEGKNEYRATVKVEVSR